MFVVSGANGQTGSVVAKTLLEKGLPVRVILRDDQDAKNWTDLGAETAVADMQNADQITAALADATGLYLMNPPAYDKADMFAEEDKVIAAFQTAIAANQGLKRIVILSSRGGQLASGTGNILTNHKLEEAFGGKENATVVRAANFMENWKSVVSAAVEKGVLPTMFAPLDKKLPMVAARDIGRVCAEALTEDASGFVLKELEGFELSPNDVAAAFSRALGKEVKAVPIPESEWFGIFSSISGSRKNAEAFIEMTNAGNSDLLQWETDEASRIKGTVTIDDFVRDVLKK